MGALEDIQAEFATFRQLVLRAIATSSHVRIPKGTTDPSDVQDGSEWIRTDTDSRYVRLGGVSVLLGAKGTASHIRLHSITDVLDHVAGTLGNVLYAGAAGAWGLLAGNTTTTKKFLTQTGDGTGSAVPAWGTMGGTISFGFSPLGGQAFNPE